MRQARTKKRISHKERELSVLQVREYIDRYHPEMKDAEVDISSGGTVASVRGVQKKDHK